MSSLSQEDLDAGWDGLDAAEAVARDVTSPEAQALKSTPPNSMTIEKSPAPLESLVVPAVTSTSNQSDSSQPDVVPAIPLAIASVEPTLPLQLHDPSVAAGVTSAPSAEASSALDAPPAEVFTVEVGSSTAQSNEVPLLQTRTTPVPGAFVASNARAVHGAPVVAQGDVPLLDSKPPPVLQSEPVASQAEPVQAAPTVSDVEQEGADIVQESPAVPLRERTSAVGVVTRDVGGFPAVARTEGAGTRSRQLRVMLWSAAALIGLGIGYVALHVRHANQQVAQPVNVTNVESKAINAAAPPARDPLAPSAPEVKAASDSVPAANSATLAGKAVNVDSASPRPQSESFSDAFVKHAATVNSNWADVKKRPRVSESNSSSRPAAVAAPASKTGDDPLNVLDQLEKARKAKKQSANHP